MAEFGRYIFFPERENKRENIALHKQKDWIGLPETTTVIQHSALLI
jgi:hypothetical protein